MDGRDSPGEIRTAVKMSQSSRDLHPGDCGPRRGGEGAGMTSTEDCRGLASGRVKRRAGGNERGGEANA